MGCDQIGPRTLAQQPGCCLRHTRAPQLHTQLAGAHPPAAPTGPAAQAPPAELRALGRADVVFAVVVCAVDNSRALSARARSLCAMVAQPTKAETRPLCRNAAQPKRWHAGGSDSCDHLFGATAGCKTTHRSAPRQSSRLGVSRTRPAPRRRGYGHVHDGGTAMALMVGATVAVGEDEGRTNMGRMKGWRR